MINRIRGGIPGSALRLAVFCGLAAAALSGTLASPAYADNDDGHGNQNKQRNEPRQRQQAHQQNWQQAHGQEQHRYYDNDRQPDVYYTAPPVIYPPPGYYQQPGASLTLSVPFFYR